MAIEKHQALALAKKHPSFASATLVLVDEHGNMRFDPHPDEHSTLSEGGDVFVVKGSLEETDHKED